MTKGELIIYLQNTYHDDDTEVCIYLNEEEGLEDCIGDIAFIDSVDDTIEDRIDLNIVFNSSMDNN